MTPPGVSVRTADNPGEETQSPGPVRSVEEENHVEVNLSEFEKPEAPPDPPTVKDEGALTTPDQPPVYEDAQTVVFENNTVNDSEQYTGGAKISLGTVKSYTEDSDNSVDNRVNNFNPIEKITELYERLLKEKDEKYAALERRLQNIEQSLQK